MENDVNKPAVPAKEIPACPVEITLMLISDKWKVLILRDLLTGTKRFGELKKSLSGVSHLRSPLWCKFPGSVLRPADKCSPRLKGM